MTGKACKPVTCRAGLNAGHDRIHRERKLKKTRPVDDTAVGDAEEKIKELTKESRELKAGGEAIENAVYDPKAMNPNAQIDEDARNPAELLDLCSTRLNRRAGRLLRLSPVCGPGRRQAGSSERAWC
jgi:hypothetical protein